MKNLLCIVALLVSSVACARLDIIVNLQVDRDTIVRKFSSTSDSINTFCEENNLKLQVKAYPENDKIKIHFDIFKRDSAGIFTLISQPEMLADPGVAATVEFHEQAPQERLPLIKQACTILGVQPKMVLKSTLKLVVIANK